MMTHVVSERPEDTRNLGRKLGELSQAGDVFLLIGSLGAGKTCLAQGVAWGLGVEGYATSPSFVLVNQYRGRLPLYHIDLYRLDTIEEVLEVGLADYLYGGGVCVVEWAEKAAALLPRDNLTIEIGILSDTRRDIAIKPRGRRYQELAHLGVPRESRARSQWS